MDLKYLKQLMRIFDESSADELYIKEEGIKLKIRRNSEEDSAGHPQMQYVTMAPPAQGYAPQPLSAPAGTSANVEAEAPAKESAGNGEHEIKSPIVGTFYRSPSPESDPFVEIGTRVGPGSTLCIIEAMKLMNEIESDVSGTVVKILVENAQPVEYNQPLFLIKPD
ncbi:MAG: acetyl-CoA carboxylase biotin carboxyl carrier protein [Bacteroidota bacterium]